MEETPLPYKIKLELKTEQERTYLRIALQKAHACAFGAIMDSRNDSELDEKTKQFNIERFSREMRLYARLLARLADATDEAEPWRGAGGREEGRRKMEKEKSPAVQGRKALTIPKRSDGMPDYNAVTEFAKLNSITTLKDLEKLGNPISGDEYVLMTKLRYRLKKSIIP